MPRNGSGTYALPEAPFVPNTAILSAEVNSDFDDIADALTGSVAADGQTLLTGGILGFAGSAALPGYAFATDPDTGFYRAGANQVGLALGGVAVGLVDSFPSGTAMLFKQTAAPTGWTKDATNNDKALRVVSGTAGIGGSTAFSTIFAARTIAQGNLPSYNLSASGLTVSGTITIALPAGTFIGLKSNATNIGAGANNPLRDADPNVPTATHSLTASGSVPSGGSGTAMDFAVQYVDVIVATKD